MGWYEGRTAEARAARLAAGVDARLEAEEEDILEKVKRLTDAEARGGDDADRADPGDRDKLFREAAECVVQNQHGSTSLLQRRMGIGYGRAARIIDQLHDAGILGESRGSKPRDVLVGLEDVERICGGARG